MASFFKKKETLVIIILLAIAIFFRFWKIHDYVVFLGDEGRDMIIMKNIFTERNIPFLGPTASVGGFYLGPIYYWMAAPFLLLFSFNPVGPAYMVAILGVLTVLLLYKLLKETVGIYSAFLASILYATAPLIVRYSRSSWNPNPLPFFALLMIYSIYKGISENKSKFFIVSGACLGITVQLHYLALNLGLISVLIFIFCTNFKKWPKIMALYTLGFFITFSPFLFFEIKHNFPNFKTILEFVNRGTTIGYNNFDLNWLFLNTGNILIEKISFLFGTIYTRLAFYLISLISLAGLILNKKDKAKSLIFKIGLIYFFGGLAAVRLYTGTIYDYYFGFMFPAIFILIGLSFSLFNKNFILKIIPALLTLVILTQFLQNAFYKTPPNRLINQTEKVSDIVIELTQNQPFNFALITGSNSDHAYRYFLETKGYAPVPLEQMITNQLIIICESQKCSPLGHPLWEIAGFGRGEIVEEREIKKYGFKIYRLIHWSGEPSPAGKPAVKGL